MHNSVVSNIFVCKVRTFKTGITVDVKTAKKQARVEDDPSFGYCEVNIDHVLKKRSKK